MSIGFSMLPATTLIAGESAQGNAGLPADPGDRSRIDTWLQLLDNGKIKILTGKMELGQGIMTAIRQVAAEELNTSPDLIEVHIAETGVTANEGSTVGSMSIQSSAMAVRNAAASARERLIDMAAAELKVKPDQVTLEDGVLTSAGKKITLADLLKGRQISDKVSTPKTILAKTRRQYVGKPLPRKEIEEVVRANRYFVQDLQFPGMVHARIVRPPGYRARLTSIDENKAKSLPGLEKLIRIGSMIGVVAADEYQAVKLAKEVAKLATWEGQTPLPAGVSLKEHVKSLPTDSQTDKETPNWKEPDLESAATVHKATYFKPYIMHAANGPSCAVAHFQDGKLSVWSHSQGVYALRDTLATLLSMPVGNIHVKGVPGSACYGHNAADDVAAEAALLAVEYPGKHVRLQWMREEENAWEPYSTPMIMALRAGLDEAGKITHWGYELWSDVHGTRPGGKPENLLPAYYIEKGFDGPAQGFRGGAVRNAEPYYAVSQMSLKSHLFTGPLRRSALRGLGAYANIFAIESFMDELAQKAGIDPIDFRIAHSTDPRAIECLKRIKANTEKVHKLPGQGLGYAFSRYKNSAAYCAVAVLLTVGRNPASVVLNKMWAVVDAGETINSDGLKNQIEGGMVQSASWTLKEEVTFDARHITSLDWGTYPILRLNGAPETDVEVIDRVEEPPLGAGEASQGPTAAAVTNAVYDAIKLRVRDLPVLKML